MKTPVLIAARTLALWVFLVFTMLPMRAEAGVAACAELASGAFNAADVKKAYGFISQHGECVDRMIGDSTFQALTAGIFALKSQGVVTADTCASVLGLANSAAVQTLIDIAGAGYLKQNLDCGCAVAYSGVDTKLKQIVMKIKECGEAFNPLAWAEDGLDQAGKAVDGLGGVLGIGGKYAEGPNGGAPTTYYICATVGKWLAPDERGPDGACDCPKKYKMEWGDGIKAPKGSMRCVADCPKDQVLQNGSCQTCPSAGSNTETHASETGLECETMGWGINCGDGKKANPDGKSCSWACSPGEIWDVAAKTCTPCGAGEIARYKSGLGSIGVCEACPEGTQPMSNQCKPCPEGAKWQAPGFCVGAFPAKACGGNEIKDPAVPTRCKPCPSGLIANISHTACISGRDAFGKESAGLPLKSLKPVVPRASSVTPSGHSLTPVPPDDSRFRKP